MRPAVLDIAYEPERKKKDRTRLQLLEAALDLIERQGFAETTINQIAEAVEVSSRTVLRYFSTKEDVIVSWVEDGMATFLSSLEQRPADEPAPASLISSARDMLASYQARANFYLTIERVIAAEFAVSARKQELSAALAVKVSAILNARKGGGARSALANELYPAVIFSVIRVAIGQWVAFNGVRPLVEVFDETVALVQFAPAEA